MTVTGRCRDGAPAAIGMTRIVRLGKQHALPLIDGAFFSTGIYADAGYKLSGRFTVMLVVFVIGSPSLFNVHFPGLTFVLQLDKLPQMVMNEEGVLAMQASLVPHIDA